MRHHTPLTRLAPLATLSPHAGRGKKAKHHRPVFFSGDGCACNTAPSHARGRSAERRGQSSHAAVLARPCKLVCDGPRQAAKVCETRCAARRLSALHARRFWASGPRFRARGQCPIQAAFAALLPRLVQPSEAAPRNWRSVVASHAAGAASRSTIRTPPEAPSLSGMESIYSISVSRARAPLGFKIIFLDERNIVRYT